MKHALLAGAARLTDKELLLQVEDLARRSFETTASLVAHLAVLDERSLYLGEGCTSLFTYCVEVLHFPEGAAYRRIRAARVAQEIPVILDALATGALSLATLELLAPHLSVTNQAELLAAARFKSKRQVEALVADLSPLPDAPTSIRRLASPSMGLATSDHDAAPSSAVLAPELPLASVASAMPVDAGAEPVILSDPGLRPDVPTEAGAAAAPAPSASTTRPAPPWAVITPLGAERYKIQFTASAQTHEKLLKAQAMLLHAIPKCDAGAVIDRALTVLVAQLEKKQHAATDRPRPGKPARRDSRHVPAAVRREVHQRDGGRCTFTSPNGRRCNAPGFIQIDHVQPHADGGETAVTNLRLLCRAHNRLAAELHFGRERVMRSIETAKQRRANQKRQPDPVTGARGNDSGGSVVHETATDDGLLRPKVVHSPADPAIEETFDAQAGSRGRGHPSDHP